VKKAFALALVLLFLSVGGMAYVFAKTDAAKAQVTFAKTVKYGDDAAAEGLEVTDCTDYNNHLFWNSTYSALSDAAKTDFSFFSGKQDSTVPEPYGVSIGNNMWALWNWPNPGGSDKLPSAQKAYQELLDETPAGQERSETFKLRDYYDYYPLEVHINVPGKTVDSGGFFAESYANKFQDFFKIPVLEDETVTITVEKGMNGSAGSGSSSTESDTFYFSSISAMTDDACYFTFDPHSSEGKLMDTSAIPGGYGIYCLPCKNGEINLSGLKTAYKIDPQYRVFGLHASADGKRLLLLTHEDALCFLTVLDAETMEPLQSLELADLPADGYVWNNYFYDDFFVIYLSDGKMVVTDEKDGKYRKAMTVETSAKDRSLYNPTYDAVMDWDGERLAVASYLPTSVDGHDFDNCSFCAAVYDRTGLAYFGEYLSSLDAGKDPSNSQDRCQRNSYLPMTVCWTDR
jgi:hypothetical protein